ncbi:MAG: hypothetical protein MUE68_01040 [Bacteroidetes bacterium]|jgi:hypothetical protein|nr:hypothetical protein [Bacteroidota bacterium]
MASIAQQIIARDREFLQFLRSRYHLFHASNVFFRDLHYGVMTYLEQQKLAQGYVAAEEVTREVVAHFEKDGILKPLDERTWVLMLEEFRAVSKKPVPPAPAPKTSVAPAAPPSAATTPAS